MRGEDVADRERFDAIRRRWLASLESERSIRLGLADKYGRRDPPHAWMLRREVLDMTAEEMEADILAMTPQEVHDELARQRSEASRRERTP